MQDYSRVLALVVDDNHYMRTIVIAMLRGIGIKQIKEASDGVEALELCRDWRPDVIITDYIMKNLDGIEFARLIRTAPDSPLPYVPIILLTGHTERHVVQTARDAGINEFIAKPLTAIALVRHLRSVIEHERKWIKSRNYTGPDRRRKKKGEYKGPQRRESDQKLEI